MVTVKKRENRIDAQALNKTYGSNKRKVSYLKDDNITQVFAGTSSSTMNYTQSKVRKMIQNYTSEENQKLLRKVSQDLYIQNQQYQRLIDYYANMPTYDYALLPFKDIPESTDSTKIKKEFVKTAEFMSRFNPKYNFNKIVTVAMQVDVFFGYVIDDGNSVMIQQFPNEICKISSLSGGVFDYVIDLEAIISNDVAEYYPTEIQEAISKYNIAKKAGTRSNQINNWYEVDSKNSVCIKINEGTTKSIPPFAGTFDSIFDIQAFKNLRNDKAEMQNYKLLVQELGIRTSSADNNDFVLDMDMMSYFHNSLAGAVPENVGVVTTPMPIETVTFDKDSPVNDNVEKASSDFWNNAGVSQILFSSDNKTSQGITMSIKTDEQVVFTILNQLERWMNRYLILNKLAKLFKCKMISVTNFSRKELTEELVKDAQYGFPVKSLVSSLTGIEPIAFPNLLKFENEILNLPSEMIPLSSSFTTNGAEITNDGGRPTNEATGTTDSDETQRAKDKPDSTTT